MRKFLVLLLLIASWAMIFSPFLVKNSTFQAMLLSQAHPSTLPLPQPWQGKPQIELNPSPAGFFEGGLPATGSACGHTYTIQVGDTLGKVARVCGFSLAELLGANREIRNPNRVLAGQQIVIPDLLVRRGGGDILPVNASPDQVGGFRPGSQFTIDAAGLPPKTPVRVGMGLSTSGFLVLSETLTDADGKLSLTLNVPVDAHPGETGFIMVTTKGIRSNQRVSRTFSIGK